MLVETTYEYKHTAEINITEAVSWEDTWVAGTGTTYSTPLTLVTSNNLTGAGKYDISRIALLFDTSDKTSSAGILSAKLKLYTLSSFARKIADGDFYLVVQNGQPIYPHDPPVDDDFDKDHYAGNGGQVIINAAIGTLQDLFIDLTATGQGWITKGGITKFFLRSSKDIDGIKPTVGLNYIRVYSYSGGYRASLIVEWDIAIPATTTDPATDILISTANLNGTLDNDGGEVCACGFEYGLDTSYGTTTPTDSKETGETFDSGLTGLSPRTVYHYRAIATNAAGTSYGADRTFRTKAKFPGNIHIDQLKYQHAERMRV